MTKKFAVTYEIDYTHRVMVGITASDDETAKQRAIEAFDEGTLWDDTEALPLLFDDYEEVDGETLCFSAKEIPSFPEPDASVQAIKQREFAFAACQFVLAGEICSARGYARRALPHFRISAQPWERDLTKLKAAYEAATQEAQVDWSLRHNNIVCGNCFVAEVLVDGDNKVMRNERLGNANFIILAHKMLPKILAALES